MTDYIFVLALKHNKYYIGRSNNYRKVIYDHFLGQGSPYTVKYKPIKVIDVFKMINDSDENNVVRKYMLNYGINNVRGGSFSNLNIDKSTFDSLIKELQTGNNICHLCGQKDHFADECINIYLISSDEDESVSSNTIDKTDYDLDDYS